MNVRWLWFDHFPPELDLTNEQKRSVRARASLHRKREPNYRGAGRRYAFVVLPLFLVAFASYYLWLDHLIRSRTTNTQSPFIVGLLPSVIVYGIIAFALHRTRTPFVRRALRDAGYEICEPCGYWLRGLGNDVEQCPECGAKRGPFNHESRMQQ